MPFMGKAAKEEVLLGRCSEEKGKVRTNCTYWEQARGALVRYRPSANGPVNGV